MAHKITNTSPTSIMSNTEHSPATAADAPVAGSGQAADERPEQRPDERPDERAEESAVGSPGNVGDPSAVEVDGGVADLAGSASSLQEYIEDDQNVDPSKRMNYIFMLALQNVNGFDPRTILPYSELANRNSCMIS